jgi:signal transduction histidine kinase
MNSIRARLSAILLLAALATALALGLVAYRQTLHQNEELFDYQLRQIALSLREHQWIGQPVARLPGGDRLEVVIRIWSASGTVLYLSDPDNPVPADVIPGFADMEANDRRWRVFSLLTPDRIIQVAQPVELRRGLAAGAALRSLTPLLAFAPLMALLIWWIVGRSLRPVRHIAAEVGRRDADALDAVPKQGAPDEILPLVAALNALLGRLKQAFAGQRAFLADAAHELRSPLTALRVQMQLLQRATDDTGRQHAMTRLAEGVERATRLIDQLLTAARTDPNDNAAPLAAVDLAEAVRLAVADTFDLAQDRQVNIGLDAPEQPVMINGDGAALRIMARNLIDNAVRYSPAGAQVRIEVTPDPPGGRLMVEDSGPGIPENEQERVFERFQRGSGHEQTGSGLGLSIVRNVVERHRASLALGRSVLGGLRVEIAFR